MEKNSEKTMVLDEVITMRKKPGFTLEDFQVKSGCVLRR